MGVNIFENINIEDVIPYIDWTPFFISWEMKGKFPSILSDEKYGEGATSLHKDATEMLQKIVSKKWLILKSVIGIWEAKQEGDDVIIPLPDNKLEFEVLKVITIHDDQGVEDKL